MFFHQNKNIEFQYKSFNFHLINLDIYTYISHYHHYYHFTKFLIFFLLFFFQK